MILCGVMTCTHVSFVLSYEVIHYMMCLDVMRSWHVRWTCHLCVIAWRGDILDEVSYAMMRYDSMSTRQGADRLINSKWVGLCISKLWLHACFKNLFQHMMVAKAVFLAGMMNCRAYVFPADIVPAYSSSHSSLTILVKFDPLFLIDAVLIDDTKCITWRATHTLLSIYCAYKHAICT